MVRHATAGTHHVVDADAEAGVAAVDHRLAQRVEERDRLGQMRAELVERQRALLESLEDQGEVELLEIAQAAVEQLAGPAGGAGREVTGLDQPDPQAAGDRVERAAAPVTPAPMTSTSSSVLASAANASARAAGFRGVVVDSIRSDLRLFHQISIQSIRYVSSPSDPQPVHQTSTQSRVRSTAFCQPA